jgi:hypothetical protein
MTVATAIRWLSRTIKNLTAIATRRLERLITGVQFGTAPTGTAL